LTVNIDAINAKILSVFQIFLILVTLEISLFGFVFNPSNFSCLSTSLTSSPPQVIQRLPLLLSLNRIP
jgi:hypothetical protein